MEDVPNIDDIDGKSLIVLNKYLIILYLFKICLFLNILYICYS